MVACVTDTSAIVAIYARELDEDDFLDAIARAEDRLLPATWIVEFPALQRLGGGRTEWIKAFMAAMAIRVPPMTDAIAFLAADAALRFGRGTRNRAHLNFGDRMSFAHAIHLQAPLPFKGDDFTFTDVEAALQR